MKFVRAIIIIGLITVFGCKTENRSTVAMEDETVTIDTLQGKSIFGKNLTRPQIDLVKDSVQIKNYEKALSEYNIDSTNVDNIIWLGRRIAYLGDYKKAISIFTDGIEIHPNEPRLYRHRGHRYITLRKFDEAIKDLSLAAKLIDGTNDKIEEDGIPNKLNQPVSSLHTNIYYHLGLAHYLQNNLEQAEDAFIRCLDASKNDDMQVATRHWLYMILRMQNKDDKAKEILEPVVPEMTIIENDAYHQLLLFYKGLKSEDELIGANSLGSNEALKYGIANWYFYNGQKDHAKTLFQDLVKSGNWAGFGYIAAEAEFYRIGI